MQPEGESRLPRPAECGMCIVGGAGGGGEARVLYQGNKRTDQRGQALCRPAVGRPANAKVAEMQVLLLPRGQEDPLY